MKAIFKNQIVEVWQVSKEGSQPQWVKSAFDKNYFQWIDNHVRVLMVGYNPSLENNVKIGLVGSAAGGGFAGYHMYQNAYLGDYIDASNFKILSAKQFAKKYRLVSEENSMTE